MKQAQIWNQPRKSAPQIVSLPVQTPTIVRMSETKRLIVGMIRK
jgi:hypothetical protein